MNTLDEFPRYVPLIFTVESRLISSDSQRLIEIVFYKDNDTFEFTRHVSVVQRPSSVESRINLKLHLNL